MTTTPKEDAHRAAGQLPAPDLPPQGVRESERAGRVTTGRVVLAELVKLGSLRSTAFALAVTVVSIVGMAVFTAMGVVAGQGSEPGAAGDPTHDPTGGALSGVSIAYFAVATLGVLSVTGEYANGMTRSSMAAVPRRSRLVAGKALAVAAFTLPVAVLSTVAAFLAARAILATVGVSLSFAQPGTARAVIGAGVYLTGIALLGTAFGWLLRSTAGALSVLIGVLLVLPTLGLLLPRAVGERFLPYLTDSAGQAIMATALSSGQLAPWTGLTVFGIWIGVALTAAALLVSRRDA